MNDEGRRKRHEEISAAAYELLAKLGYGGTTMLKIAQAASASNETLYKWYGDKDGLFARMVEDNAAGTRRMLEAAYDSADAPIEVLAAVAPVLLRMLLGERAILLNRAAAADPSGRLGAAISAHGRDAVQPMLGRVIAPLCRGSDCDPAQATGWFVSLLVGDLQIRRVIGALPVPDEAQIAARCHHALTDFSVLVGRA